MTTERHIYRGFAIVRHWVTPERGTCPTCWGHGATQLRDPCFHCHGQRTIPLTPQPDEYHIGPEDPQDGDETNQGHAPTIGHAKAYIDDYLDEGMRM